MSDVTQALVSLYPNCEWSIEEGMYEKLTWTDTNTSKPTLEELTAKHEELVAAKPLKDLRKKRDDLLVKTDKYALPDWPHASLAKQSEWLEYRQALRDLPSNTEDPANPVWPTVPSP
jgi:hypothetical protein